jgi:hypothetical protein
MRKAEVASVVVVDVGVVNAGDVIVVRVRGNEVVVGGFGVVIEATVFRVQIARAEWDIGELVDSQQWLCFEALATMSSSTIAVAFGVGFLNQRIARTAAFGGIEILDGMLTGRPGDRVRGGWQIVKQPAQRGSP